MWGYLRAIRHYFDFTGRMKQSEFVGFMLVQALIYVAAQLIWGREPDKAELAAGLIFAFHLIPLLSAEVRRLHDVGKEGWFVLLQLFPLMAPLMVLILMVRPAEGGYGSVKQLGASPPTDATVHDLERLAGLRKTGAPSEEEFQQLKSRLFTHGPKAEEAS